MTTQQPAIFKGKVLMLVRWVILSTLFSVSNERSIFMKKERTLTNLLDNEKPVYLVFRNKAIFNLFREHAEKEGFLISDNMPFHSYLHLNNDMTFSSVVGMAGHMMAYQDRTTILAIDYAKYINGCDDYIAPKGHPDIWK